jgi:hypothetical protein
MFGVSEGMQRLWTRDLNGYRIRSAHEIEALSVDDIRRCHQQMQVER